MSLRDDLSLLLQSNLPGIASKLYSKSIISSETLAEATNQLHSANIRTVSLLSVVEARIRTEPYMFTEFVKTVESEPSLIPLAKRLILRYQGTIIIEGLIQLRFRHPNWLAMVDLEFWQGFKYIVT